ncbi:zinc-dependent peptidase [Flavobacterium sp.]|uniref:zinc-dependent peptidase n=1 Tax=Flavobacterium sp. TaxID=239 RepID=UPI00375298E5
MIIILLILFTPAVALFIAFLYTVAEDNYGLLFNKPFYVHFYPKVKSLSVNQSYVLKEQFHYYNTLSDNKKKYFEHRVAVFISKYEFIGKEEFLITDEVKILIASTSVMLTFGMRNYLYSNIDKIIVYPEQYYSTINEVYHKGEFNPRMRTIVFSWQDFKAGFEITNDNLNLGIHEFTHVLHLHGLMSDDASAIIFSRMHNQIQKEVNHPVNKEKLISSAYFRIYAYTNRFEFLAVILEHYFESPEIFKQEFPQLYSNVSKMLNHKH